MKIQIPEAHIDKLLRDVCRKCHEHSEGYEEEEFGWNLKNYFFVESVDLQYLNLNDQRSADIAVLRILGEYLLKRIWNDQKENHNSQRYWKKP